MCETANEQNRRYPTECDPLWFKDREYSRFDDAFSRWGENVRVSHLDTDYDPAQQALRFLN